jgi:hypothetical protein
MCSDEWRRQVGAESVESKLVGTLAVDSVEFTSFLEEASVGELHRAQFELVQLADEVNHRLMAIACMLRAKA